MEYEGFESVDHKGIVPFGKYEGKLFSEVLRDDPAYCTWVQISEDDVSDMLIDFQTYLKEQGFEPVLEKGKHAGKHYREVMKEDPSYCRWVMSLDREEGTSSSIILFKKFLEKQRFALPSAADLIQQKWGQQAQE